MSVTITLPDGKTRSYPGPVSGAEVAASIGPGLAKAAMVVRVDGALRDLTAPIAQDSRIAIVTSDQPEALEILRHDAAHVLAEAATSVPLTGPGSLLVLPSGKVIVTDMTWI